MKLIYKDKKVEKKCTDIKIAKKEFNIQVVNKLYSVINFLKSAESLRDVANMPMYHLHQLQGKRKGTYAIDLGRALGFRLIIKPLDDNEKEIENHDDINVLYRSTKIVLILEVSNHYE